MAKRIETPERRGGRLTVETDWRIDHPTGEFPSRIGVSGHDGQVTIYSAPLTADTLCTARLIQAAPSLRSACKAALEDLEPFEDIDLPNGYAVKGTCILLRNALAQAAGVFEPTVD